MVVFAGFFMVFQVFVRSKNHEKSCFFMFLMVWGVPGGFPVVRVIILDMGGLYMMVSGFIFDLF